MHLRALTLSLILLACGCASPPESFAPRLQPVPATAGPPQTDDDPSIVLTNAQEETAPGPPTSDDAPPDEADPELAVPAVNPPVAAKPEDKGVDSQASDAKPNDAGEPSEAASDPNVEPLVADAVTLASVIESVHDSFPLVEAAYRETEIASGNVIAAQGGFDTKVKAASENGPTGFYQTYRQKAGVYQPLYSGGEVFGGYRIGRGDFEPWYQERQTNDGGEFKVGASVPLLRNSDIDARRAALWRANYDTQIAQPEIRGQLIGFTLDASLVYWKWVAEGRKYFAERDWLAKAVERNENIKVQFDKGAIGKPDVTDSRRAIAKRRAKVVDQLRKVQQAAIKLSLFLRSADGTPIVPTLDQLPNFPKPSQPVPEQLDNDIAIALTQRPDLEVLRLVQKRLRVDYEEAANMGLPKLDAYLIAGQDVGEPTSKKRDKSRFEVDVGLMFDVPVQRRKATGKMQAVEAKIAQVNAKERFTIDKISAGVRAAFAGIRQAYQQLEQASEARQLAEEMAEIERQRLDLGASDLLKVALREQYAIEAIEGEVTALQNYFAARSQYFAELGEDRGGSN